MTSQTASSVEEIYRVAAQAGSRPDPAMLVSAWADQHRQLTARSSPEPGPWRTERTPYLKAIMDDLSPSSRVERVIWMKAAQIGATEAGNNWIGYNIHQAPGPMMAVQPTTEMAKRNSKQRIEPLIQSCDVLRERVRDPRSRDAGNTVLAKEFPGGILVMVGANSAKGLRSMSARYLFLDEVDGYPGDVDSEGDPVDLAIERTANYPRRKIFLASTPTISGRSRIEKFYFESDQRQYWVPCPKCREMQVLLFEQLEWPKGEPHETRYRCAHCSFPMSDHHKNWMLPRGEWRAAAEGDGRTHGYHLSSLYSPVGWKSWAEIAMRYERSGNDREKLQVFWNTTLGMAYTDAGEAPDSQRLYERRETYRIGIVPRGGLLLTAGVDVQLRRLEIEIVAWGRHRESWSIDYRVIDGDTSQPEVWREAAKILDEEFPTEYGLGMRIHRMAVDSGFNTTTIYNWTRQMNTPRVMLVKGETRTPALLGASAPIEVGPQGQRIRFGIKLWPVNTNIAKEELYRWLRLPVPNLELNEPYSQGFCHFPEYNLEHFEQLCAEKLVLRTINGYKHPVWQKIRERNEALDCRIYNRAAVASLRMDLWPEERWEQLEEALTPRSVEAAPAKPGGNAYATPVPSFRSFSHDEGFLD